MVAIEKDPSVFVEATDGLVDAIEAAKARVAAVYAHGAETLVSEIPAEAWATWHLSAETALVADADALDCEDDAAFDCAA